MQNGQTCILHTDALTVGYGKTPVVENIALMAQPGKILTLIGPNGAGKSTILKTLIRQLRPISGEISLLGRPMAQLSELELARCSAAVLTARPEAELMSCEDVVSAGRYPYTGRMGLLSPRDRAAVAEAMALVGVLPLRETDFHRLSDGQRQRVMLARAICQQPRLLIMDEPTSFLDIRHKMDFLYLLKKLIREKEIAVVMSMHELDLAQKFSDVLCCVREGRIDRCGTPEEIFSGDYIASLYGLTHGRYDAVFGSVEATPLHGRIDTFVIGGAGKGVPVYRALQRRGIPFAAGVLTENDMDLPVAAALAEKVICERGFEPVSRASVDEAMELLAGCRTLICCVTHFGSLNRENERLRAYAAAHGMLLTPDAFFHREDDAAPADEK